MTRRLTAHIEAITAHVIEHVAVADGRSHQRELQFLKIALKAEIGHHRRNDAARGKAAIRLPALGNDREELIAIDHAAALIHKENAVRIAVERNADIGTHFLDLLAQGGRLC